MGDLHSKLCILIYTVSSLLLDCTLRKECLEIFVVLDIDITVSLTNLLTSMNELKSYSNLFYTSKMLVIPVHDPLTSSCDIFIWRPAGVTWLHILYPSRTLSEGYTHLFRFCARLRRKACSFYFYLVKVLFISLVFPCTNKYVCICRKFKAVSRRKYFPTMV